MKYVMIFTALVFLTSCTDCGSGKQKANEQETSHQSHTSEVCLDNGKKWKVNFATTKGINNMKARLEAISEKSTLADYRKLGEGLQTEFRHIFQRCDMTGEAHNQLHNYLQPMPAWFSDLKEGDMLRCRSAVVALNSHLKRFDTYFR